MIILIYFIIGLLLASPILNDDAIEIVERIPAALIVFFLWGLLVLLFFMYKLFKFLYEAKRNGKRKRV